MSAITTKNWGQAFGLALLILASGCSEEPLPKRQISRQDCLREIKLNKLEDSIKRCDAVVATFPSDPIPLNERFLLHSLAGNNEAACRDIAKAKVLANKLPVDQVDALLRNNLKVRSESCQD